MANKAVSPLSSAVRIRMGYATRYNFVRTRGARWTDTGCVELCPELRKHSLNRRPPFAQKPRRQRSKCQHNLAGCFAPVEHADGLGNLRQRIDRMGARLEAALGGPSQDLAHVG